jgi:hypothetical protein
MAALGEDLLEAYGFRRFLRCPYTAECQHDRCRSAADTVSTAIVVDLPQPDFQTVITTNQSLVRRLPMLSCCLYATVQVGVAAVLGADVKRRSPSQYPNLWQNFDDISRVTRSNPAAQAGRS